MACWSAILQVKRFVFGPVQVNVRGRRFVVSGPESSFRWGRAPPLRVPRVALAFGWRFFVPAKFQKTLMHVYLVCVFDSRRRPDFLLWSVVSDGYRRRMVLLPPHIFIFSILGRRKGAKLDLQFSIFGYQYHKLLGPWRGASLPPLINEDDCKSKESPSNNGRAKWVCQKSFFKTGQGKLSVAKNKSKSNNTLKQFILWPPKANKNQHWQFPSATVTGVY